MRRFLIVQGLMETTVSTGNRYQYTMTIRSARIVNTAKQKRPGCRRFMADSWFLTSKKRDYLPKASHIELSALVREQYKTKRHIPRDVALCWCRWPDSNRHAVASGGF